MRIHADPDLDPKHCFVRHFAYEFTLSLLFGLISLGYHSLHRICCKEAEQN